MTSKQLKDLNKLWDKKIEGLEMTKTEKQYFKELNQLWEDQELLQEINSWEANQPI